MEKTTFTNKQPEIALALGFFDCVHRGHRSVLTMCQQAAKKHLCETAVFTFKDDIGKSSGKQIYTYEERLKLFSECGFDNVVAYPFDEKVKNMEPIEFLDDLCSKYNIGVFVCGSDYTFGKDGKGDLELLRQYSILHGIIVIVAIPAYWYTERISSTLIKGLLANGKVGTANMMLGKNYFLTGTVVSGRGEGHFYGIPTANVKIPDDKFLPKHGVYACKFTVGDKEYRAVTNLGEKPTFGDYSITIEALIGGFDEDIYGKEVTITFYEYLRGIEKFDSPNELADQVKKELQEWEEKC